MNLKLLFFCLVLTVLFIPAELKRRKHHKHGHHGHHHDHDHHGPGDHKKGKRGERFHEIIGDIFFGIVGDGEDDDDDDPSNSDWVLELQEPDGRCNPNPCLNNGECEEKGRKRFKCDCPRPFRGRRCEKGPRLCKKGRCGRGECVLTSTAPFYECKCKEPFQPPRCTSFTLCEPNPCKNGGKCVKDGDDFDCECPLGYRGRFCHVGPDDCFVDDGETYRGNVSETDDGRECLYWNSHFILEKGADPLNAFEDQDGLGPHNFCRNPDGETMPWCFYRRGRRLLWDYCDVLECPEPTVVPTEEPPVPDPTDPKPQPPKPSTTVPSPTTEPSQAPKTTPAPTDSSLVPNATAEPQQQFATCGKPQPKKQMTRIYGGSKVPPGGIPWQVSIQVKPKKSNGPFQHTCGGVLIESCWVLTAAHCVEPMKEMQVVMGGQTLNDEGPTDQTLQVEKAIVHENFREAPTAVYNDIALLKLNGIDGVCANETQFVKTVCLPDGPLPDGTDCTISGWGATEDSVHGSNHLLEADVMLINQEKCSETKIYGKVLDESMFCAGHLQGGVDSCQGDSGGPLTCKQNGTHVIYGVVSWGDKCGRKNKPGVYARVTHFLDWIKSKIQTASP